MGKTPFPEKMREKKRDKPTGEMLGGWGSKFTFKVRSDGFGVRSVRSEKRVVESLKAND